MPLTSSRTAQDIMNTEVITVPEDMPLSEFAAMAIENEISGAPVVNSDDEIVGVVTLRDLAASRAEGVDISMERPSSFYIDGWEDQLDPLEVSRMRYFNHDQVVKDVMTPTVFSVDLDTPVSAMARAMVAGRVHRLLVMDGNRLAGIVTTLDILRHLFPS